MAEAPEFEPRELDLLEDALEGLEGVDDLGELGLEPRLTDRLDDYRKILLMSRDALALEEVPAGLLDDVIAQAARAEASPVVVNAGVAAATEEASPWWQRWRRWMVPTLALAGSAAAVLWIVAPETEGDMIVSEGYSEKSEAKADERGMDDGRLGGVAPVESAALPTAPSDGAGADRATGRAAFAELTKEEADAEPEEEAAAYDESAEKKADSKPGAMPAPAPAKKTKSAGSKAKPAAGGGLGDGDDPFVDDVVEGAADKDGVWELIEQGEKSLSHGNCSSAKRSFKKVLASKSADALALARAHAGIGVCLEWEGDVKKASGSFDQARLFQPGDAGNDLINSQRNRLPPPSEQKKAPKAKKKSASSADAFEL